MSWAGSDRRSRLPPDWPTTRARIKRRDPTCRCRGCPKCSLSLGCVRPTTDIDHVIAGDDHRDGNLQGLCNPCHKHKTGAERVRLTNRRPKVKHPGLL